MRRDHPEFIIGDQKSSEAGEASASIHASISAYGSNGPW